MASISEAMEDQGLQAAVSCSDAFLLRIGQAQVLGIWSVAQPMKQHDARCLHGPGSQTGMSVWCMPL